MIELADLVGRLVSIDSVNPELVPGGAGEAAIAGFVSYWLEQVGLEVQLDEPVPGRPSVVGIAKGSGGGRSLMLNAHLDTVGVAGMLRPHQPRVEEGCLYGRGAYDMKGGLAAIMVAAAQARHADLRGDVIVTAVADEEYTSIGTDSIVRRWRADAAIVTEPTALNICVAHKGFIWFEIETQGRAAHGSRPDLGVDAIAKMGKVLVGLDELDQALRAQPRHRLLGSGSLHASLINGGQELSSYPDRCLLRLERRTVPGESSEEALSQIQAILDRLASSDPDFRATLRTAYLRSPFEVEENAPIVAALRRQAQAVLGVEPPLVGETPWMDAAILSAAGIPTVVFGPAGSGAHALEEWVDLESVARCADVLTATIKDFCA